MDIFIKGKGTKQSKLINWYNLIGTKTCMYIAMHVYSHVSEANTNTQGI